MKRKNKILAPYPFDKTYSRGEQTVIDGIELVYVKMVKGKLFFRSVQGYEKYIYDTNKKLTKID